MPAMIPSLGRYRFFAVVCAFAVLSALPALAQEEPALLSPNSRLDAMQEELSDPGLTKDVAEQNARIANVIRANSTKCVEDLENQIQRLESNLLILGEAQDTPTDEETLEAGPVREEPEEVAARRAALEAEINTLRNDIASCKLLQLRARDLNETALSRLGELLAKRLMSHGTPSLEALRDDIVRPGDATRRALAYAARPDAVGRLSTGQSLLVALVCLMGFGVGVGVRRLIQGWAEKQRGRGGEPAIEVVYMRTFGRWLRIVLAALAGSIALTVFLAPDASELPLVRLFYALAALGVLGMLIDWFTGPYSPGADFLSDPALEAAIRKRGQAVGVALLLGYVAFGSNWLFGTPPGSGLVVRAGITVFAAAAVIWLVRGAWLIPEMRGRIWLLRAVIVTAAMAAVIAELLGYRNLSNHLMRASLGTLGAGFVLWITLWLIRSAVEGIVSGKADASYKVRNWLGMRPNESSAELGWLRLILSVALWLAFAVVLIVLWDSTGSALPKLTSVVTEGVALSQDYTLVPQDVIKGLVVFGLIIALTAWVKARMTKRWLRDMGMDRGAREALVTLGGYVGFILAVLLGLILSGVDFGGLAIVLGALGVGIGFGLQNIVGNFVSGIILLFERPIKSGDFVSIGDVEGIVKSIRIRSTEIESLDRRNIIVPNSELVSTQVTNWVLHDQFGRLTLSIGVAYGSDTEQVRELLEQIAADHPEALSKGPVPPPRALFMEFGDSSLNFELRVWIRHIEKRFRVTSDLNFAIDKAFREANIEIPFPQRDLHIRSWSGEAMPVAGSVDGDDHRNDQPGDSPSKPGEAD
ncbi:MAG: mechanosensitive ion channel domain-containing protein [Gammaproteobacteria bacterium]